MITPKRFLLSLGFDDTEANLYLTALSLGTTQASILGNRLKIPHSTARYLCDRLVQKGLFVVSKKRNTKLFTAENPTKLYSIVMAEREAAERRYAELGDVIKMFQEIYRPESNLPKVTFYEGLDGISRMMKEMTRSPIDTLMTYSAGDYMSAKIPGIVQAYRKGAQKNQKNVLAIRGNRYREKYEFLSDPSMKTRFFDTLDELKVDIELGNEGMTIVSIEDGAPIGIHIQHRAIVSTFREIFTQLWNTLER